jgi:hypothetical protein
MTWKLFQPAVLHNAAHNAAHIAALIVETAEKHQKGLRERAK